MTKTATYSKHVDAEGRVSVFRLQVPLALALGLYDDLTDEQLTEHYHDIMEVISKRERQTSYSIHRQDG